MECIQSTLDMFRTANEYLAKHEEDNDRLEQDQTMKTILLLGVAMGIGIGLVVSGIVAVAVKMAK